MLADSCGHRRRKGYRVPAACGRHVGFFFDLARRFALDMGGSAAAPAAPATPTRRRPAQRCDCMSDDYPNEQRVQGQTCASSVTKPAHCVAQRRQHRREWLQTTALKLMLGAREHACPAARSSRCSQSSTWSSSSKRITPSTTAFRRFPGCHWPTAAPREGSASRSRPRSRRVAS